MKIPYQRGKLKEKEVEFFIVGNSFMLVEPGKTETTVRIGPFSPGQWALISRAGKEREK